MSTPGWASARPQQSLEAPDRQARLADFTALAWRDGSGGSGFDDLAVEGRRSTMAAQSLGSVKVPGPAGERLIGGNGADPSSPRSSKFQRPKLVLKSLHVYLDAGQPLWRPSTEAELKHAIDNGLRGDAASPGSPGGRWCARCAVPNLCCTPRFAFRRTSAAGFIGSTTSTAIKQEEERAVTTYVFTYVIDHQLSGDEIDALFDRVDDVTPERVQARRRTWSWIRSAAMT